MSRKKAETKEPVDLGEMDMSCPVLILEDTTPKLGIFADPDVEIPKYATEGSACFDLAANLVPGTVIKGFGYDNKPVVRPVKIGGRLHLEPGDRVLIPTGLYMDIPDNHVVNIYPRSGTSWKQGLILTNSVAVIDSDYVNEVFISITNISHTRVVVENGTRIAQAALAPVTRATFVELASSPQPKTTRNGGFGSTGSK